LRATPNDPSEALGSGNYAISAFLLRCMSPEVALKRRAVPLARGLLTEPVLKEVRVVLSRCPYPEAM